MAVTIVRGPKCQRPGWRPTAGSDVKGAERLAQASIGSHRADIRTGRMAQLQAASPLIYRGKTPVRWGAWTPA